MAIVRYTLDPANPPITCAEKRARLEAMTDEEITAAAESDLHKSALIDQDITPIHAIRIARRTRERTDLTQAAFAELFAVNLSRSRDIEQGRNTPDRVLASFLALVAVDPERARRVMAETF